MLMVGCSTSFEEGEEVIDTAELQREASLEFRFPLNEYRRVSRGFQARHKGIDVSAPKGTPILASESGWITYQGSKFRGFGKLVIVEHSKKWATFYAHMSKFSVKEGVWVNKGDVIGYVGNTGRSRGHHLHFEVRYKNRAIDPLPYFNRSEIRFAHSKSFD